MIVVYKSSTGFTKRYAEMIASELKCASVDFNTVTSNTLDKYHTIIFGTRAHAGMIDGYQKAKKLFGQRISGSVILFVTGATPNTDTEIIKSFWNQNLTMQELTEIPHFYMQSGLCYEKMSLMDKLMMKVAAIMIKNKKNKTPQDMAFEQEIKSSYDISSKIYIEPLITYIKTKNERKDNRCHKDVKKQ